MRVSQVSRRVLAALPACVTAALVLTVSAAATPVLDQQQAVVDPQNAPLIGGSGPQVMAQVVRSGMAGLLAQVDVPLSCNDGATLVLQIRDAAGRPGERVLASETLTGIPRSAEWRSIALATPPFIPSDTEFAIVLSASGNCSTRAGPEQQNLYLPGDGYYQGPPNPPGVWSFAGSDVAFKTFVERICKVPDLVGKPETDAAQELVSHGCSLGRVTRTYSRTVPRGDVISQTQPEGTQLAAGATVNVVVSRGRRMCKVPNVRRKPLAQARRLLARAACRVGAVRRVPSAKKMKGRVIRQRPAPGTRLPEGGRVNLVLGRGRA